MTVIKTCSFCGIDEKHTAIEKYNDRYFCKRHYLQYMRHGKCFQRTIYDPNGYKINGDTSIIFLYDKSGNVTGQVLLDTEDLETCIAYKWHMKKSLNTNYATSTMKGGRKIFLHRLVLGYNGNMDVDHINGNGLDNRKLNLRIVPRSKNIFNQRKPLTGIFKVKSGRFRASVCHNYKTIYIGTYDTKEEAVEARNKKCLELGI